MSKNIYSRRFKVVKRVSFDKATRLKIYKRFNGICYLCGKMVAYKSMHIDHIVALASGGNNALSNLAPTHAACNLKKGKRNGTI